MLGGFGWNLAIATLAVVIGTALACLLEIPNYFAIGWLSRFVNAVISIFRNTPTLVLLFYLSMLVPKEIFLFDTGLSVTIPSWVKAAVGLSASPLVFTYWNIDAAINEWKSGNHKIVLLFIPNWLATFSITLLASSVSSLVGVSELVGRCNTIINASSTDHMIAIYIYASVFFWVLLSMINVVTRCLRNSINSRYFL